MRTTTDYSSNSKIITDSFSKAAANYHKKAEIQKKVASGLLSSLIPWKGILPEGPILEVGCGTGFLSRLLIEEFPERNIHLTDASAGMLDFARHYLDEEKALTENVTFGELNVDGLEEGEESYSLIISNFAAQWFKDTAMGLEKLMSKLKPGGLILCSFPGNNSFREWYECCLELGLPFTANALPDVEEVVIKLSMGPVQIDYYENDLQQNFAHSIDFFKHLKEIGVASSTSGKRLSARQMKLLTDFWDKKTNNNININWHVVYLAGKKDG